MPILVPVNDNEPLGQGDLLRGVSLHVTVDDWRSHRALPSDRLSLVISRPCVLAHKPRILVASVESHRGQIENEPEDFDELRDFLEELRDGKEMPDGFYVGHLPGDEDSGRLIARLDSIHTIELPAGGILAEQLRSHRVATLHVDFRRELHSRIFRSIASLGFDDICWYSTADLRWLVHKGEFELQGYSVAVIKDTGGAREP